MAHPFYLTPTSKQTLYYYNNSNNEPVGPLAIEKLRDMFQNKQLGPHVWVIEKGGSDWKRLSDLLSSNPVQTIKKAPLPMKSAVPASTASHVPLPPFAAAAKKKIEPQIVPQIAPKVEHKFEPKIEKFEPKIGIPTESATPKHEPLYVSRIASLGIEIPEPTQAPMAVQIIAVIGFISGFSNIFVGLTWAAAGIFFLKGSLLVSLIPAAFGMVVGIYNIINASRLISVQPVSQEMARYLALLDIASIAILNPVACMAGFLNSIIRFLSPHARAYFSNSSNS